MNILVTGYKGFIGANLIKKLDKHNIIGIDLKDGENVLDKAFLEEIFAKNNIDVVVHLAAIAGVGYSVEHSEEVLYNNIVGFDTLAKASIKHNVKHFVYASSSSVYGDDGEMKSPYAISKKTNEFQASVYSNLYDIKFTGMRFFTVYGKGIRKDLAISKFINAMREGRPIYVYGDGSQSRDFTYIDDITEAIRLIIDSDKNWENEVFDIGYGTSTTINELIDILKEYINPTFDNIIYEEEKPYDVNTTLATTDKLYEWFGFKPKYNLKRGLKEMVKQM